MSDDMTVLSKLKLMEREAIKREMPEVAAICAEAIAEIRRLATYEFMYRELCDGEG